MSKRKRDVEEDIDESSSGDESGDEEEGDDDIGTLTGLAKSSMKPETGQILSVEAEDFMCHKKFSIKFGRNVNFVTGANGSGKSAIVAAIQLCLGASAKTTGRASSARSFVRDGSKNGFTVVRVTLRNDGEDTYRPDDYNNIITVERKITNKGVSTYRIMGQGGNLVTTDFREIGQILKRFSIYVDNPCCLLTQEASKQFIQGSEEAKYEFFLKATGLQRTKEELEVARLKMQDTDVQCGIAEEKLGMQREKLDKLERELEELRALDKFESQISEFKSKLHWHDVYAFEAQYEEEELKLADLQRRLVEAQKKKAVAERKIEDMGTVESLTANSETMALQHGAMQKELDAAGRTISELEGSRRHVESEVKDLSNTRLDYVGRISAGTKEIEKMQRQAMANSAGKERAIREKLETAEQGGKDAMAQEQELRRQHANEDQERQELERRLGGQRHEVRQLENELRRSESELRELQSNVGGGGDAKFRVINKCLPEIMRKIAQTKFKHPVIGPIVAHVKLTPEAVRDDCARAVERIIGNKLPHFLVGDSQDAVVLKNIIRSVGTGEYAFAAGFIDVSTCFKSAGVTRYRVDALPPGAVSVMSCLQIDNDDVFNYLVNTCGIQSVVLAESQADCRRKYTTQSNGTLRFIHPIKSAVFKPDAMTYKIVNGSSNSENFRGRFNDFLSEDAQGAVEAVVARVAEEKNVLSEKKNSIKNAEVPLQELKQRCAHFEPAQKKFIDMIKGFNAQKKELTKELNAVQEAEQTDTTDLESEREELQLSVNELAENITRLEGLSKEKAAELKVATDARKEIDRRRRELSVQIDAHERQLGEFIVERGKATRQHEYEAHRVRKLEVEIIAQDKHTGDRKYRFEEQQEYAFKMSRELLLVPEQWDGESRIPLTSKEKGSKAVIEQKVLVYKRHLEAGKERVGLVGRDKKTIQAKLTKAQVAYDDDVHRLEDLKSIVANLWSDSKIRMTAWSKQLKISAKAVSRQFDNYMQEKGFAGTVNFDHCLKQLHIVALTDNMDTNTQCNDIRQCSGGERSYTTFCLLLALGSVIETPFQLMDEYDVFMDQKSRSMTLHMLKDHALTSDQARKQFIVLTPQTLNGVVVSKKCRIQALRPPDRSSAHGLQQQTL